MLRNYLKIAIRNSTRQKGFSLLHLLGLTLGILVSMLVVIYSSYELGFDKFHDKLDRIVRINQTFIWGDEDALFGSTGPAVKHALENEIPEFEEVIRVHTPAPYFVTVPQEKEYFEETNVLAADPGFFNLFTFPLSAGDPKTALDAPQSIVLTSETAEKYFGDQQAIGQLLQLESNGKTQLFKVTGVAESVPDNSHIQFDMVISMSSLPRVQKASDSWMWTTFVTFGLLREGANHVDVAAKVAQVPGKYLGSFLQKYRGISYQEFIESGEEWDLYIQPLADIHLYSAHVFSRLNTTGDINDLYIFWLVAALVLTISVINFINLSTAKAASRAKEVGVRKVIGSNRTSLIMQFMVESLLLVLTALVLALTILHVSLPLFSNLLEVPLTNLFLSQTGFFIFALLAGVLLAAIAGFYPALYLSSFRPAVILKGKIAGGFRDSQVRNTLMVVQFSISIALIACTLIVSKQVQHWKTADLGFSRENKIVLHNIERLSSYEPLQQEIAQSSLVDNVSYSSDTPPYLFDFDQFGIRGKDVKASVNYLTADEQFLPAYDLSLLAGRNFGQTYQDSLSVIVNEQFLRAFALGSPSAALGEQVEYSGKSYKIIGIVLDFNANISNEKYPTAIFENQAPIYRNQSRSLTIDLNRELTAGQTVEMLTELEKKWVRLSPRAPFEYSFVDESFMAQFKRTMQFGNILKGLSGMAIIISCLGLIGLITFVIEKKHKEIGIRKVLGAPVSSILLLLTGTFGKLLAISFAIATPISYWMMSRWLENYPLRITIPPGIFILAGLLMLVIAVIAVAFQSIKASKINPVQYLRDE